MLWLDDPTCHQERCDSVVACACHRVKIGLTCTNRVADKASGYPLILGQPGTPYLIMHLIINIVHVYNILIPLP